jgi:hypothetical protein
MERLSGASPQISDKACQGQKTIKKNLCIFDTCGQWYITFLLWKKAKKLVFCKHF